MVEILPQPTDAHNCFSLICQRKEMVRRLWMDRQADITVP
jgi:hypothetical protein